MRLEKLIASSETASRLRQRARVILLRADGKTYADIEKELAISTPTIAKILKKCFAYGVDEALGDLDRTGRNDVIDAGAKAAKKYPLQCFGYHGHGRTHSTFHNLPWLREVHPDQVLINELDAKVRNIADGDKVHVFNDRGCIEVPAHVTKRIMPGVCAVPQGAWYKPVKKDGKTIDVGACINTLTGHRPSPLAKGNP